jgi:hypothetical protein
MHSVSTDQNITLVRRSICKVQKQAIVELVVQANELFGGMQSVLGDAID